MTIQSGVLILALLCLGVGIVSDVVISEKVKGPNRGPLDGTFRPQSWRGFSTGLPWYLLRAFRPLRAAWGHRRRPPARHPPTQLDVPHIAASAPGPL